MLLLLFSVLASVIVIKHSNGCASSETLVSGTHAPSRFCSGDLIFDVQFNEFDLERWQHEITLSGGGNWEFQYYNNNRTNSFTHDGILFIRPSLTSDQFGEDFLTSGNLNVDGGTPAERCTDARDYGCQRTGTPEHIINPIKSAKIRTVNSFNFRYGRVEVRAKMPAGDWLWPAIWLMPTSNSYGTWPSSGEIDLVESRGNRRLSENSVNIGVNQVSSTLHYGPYWAMDAWAQGSWAKRSPAGYDADFHHYQMEWTSDYIKFCVDDEELGKVSPGSGGFWKLAHFNNINGLENPWRYGSKMAPFDQKFFIIINLAVGGTDGYFSDNALNINPKPWSNTSPHALTDFWNNRKDWQSTWNLDQNDGQHASLQVDYVKVWAI